MTPIQNRAVSFRRTVLLLRTLEYTVYYIQYIIYWYSKVNFQSNFLALGQANDESALNALKGCYKTGYNQPRYL